MAFACEQFEFFQGMYPTVTDPCEHLHIDADRVLFCKKFDPDKKFGIKHETSKLLPSKINGCLYSPGNCPLKRPEK